MIEYSICNQADEEIFKKQCAALEKKITGLKKEQALKDVDGSLTQVYSLGTDSISVHNSYYCNEVYIRSTIDLRQFFAKQGEIVLE